MVEQSLHIWVNRRFNDKKIKHCMRGLMSNVIKLLPPPSVFFSPAVLHLCISSVFQFTGHVFLNTLSAYRVLVGSTIPHEETDMQFNLTFSRTLSFNSGLSTYIARNVFHLNIVHGLAVKVTIKTSTHITMYFTYERAS